MTDYHHIVHVLKQLSPMEVLEMCGIEEDSDKLVDTLCEFIDCDLELIEERLIASGVIDEGDE